MKRKKIFFYYKLIFFFYLFINFSVIKICLIFIHIVYTIYQHNKQIRLFYSERKKIFFYSIIKIILIDYY